MKYRYKWIRYSAFGIGIVFGLLYLTAGIFNLFWEMELNTLRISDWIILIFGPLSLIVMTCIAGRFERVSGWWLLVSSIITAVLFSIRLWETPLRLLITFLVYPFPMFIAGLLWLIDSYTKQDSSIDKI